MTVVLKVGLSPDGSPRHRLVVNDLLFHIVQSLTEYPEDAIIGRDLIDGNDLIRAIRLGHHAAMNNEVLEITSEIDDDVAQHLYKG